MEGVVIMRTRKEMEYIKDVGFLSHLEIKLIVVSTHQDLEKKLMKEYIVSFDKMTREFLQGVH